MNDETEVVLRVELIHTAVGETERNMDCEVYPGLIRQPPQSTPKIRMQHFCIRMWIFILNSTNIRSKKKIVDSPNEYVTLCALLTSVLVVAIGTSGTGQ